MKTISGKQTGLIKTLIKKLGADSVDIALDYSDGRTEHISKLYSNEASQLIKWLLNEAGQTRENPADVMKNKILAIAHEMHWELPFTRNGKSNIIDMVRVDGWCIKYGYLNKPLDDYTEAELPRLVTQFQKAHKSFVKGI